MMQIIPPPPPQPLFFFVSPPRARRGKEEKIKPHHESTYLMHTHTYVPFPKTTLAQYSQLTPQNMNMDIDMDINTSSTPPFLSPSNQSLSYPTSHT